MTVEHTQEARTVSQPGKGMGAVETRRLIDEGERWCTGIA